MVRNSRDRGRDGLQALSSSARIGAVRIPAAAAGDSRGNASAGSGRESGSRQADAVESGPEYPQTPLVSDSFVRPTFTIEQIRTFLIVASREHITQAARALGLSQPAVTQQVQLLERCLGVRLLERLGR